MTKSLIIGYGNVDRQDDGIAWHILVACAKKLDLEGPFSYEEGFPLFDGQVQLIYSLQLMPEMAEEAAQYDRVVFVDAHTGAVPEEIHVETVSGQFQSSPLTHHFTPQSCISLVRTLYHANPQAILVSVRGYEFKFSHELSARTASLVEPACREIMNFLGE
jgi:hydrogenase maturation protease